MFVDFAEKKWENCVRGFMKKWFTEKVLLKYWVENASKYKLKDGRCIVDDSFLRDIRDNKLLSSKSKSKKERIIEVDRSPQVSTYSGRELINILQGRISESKAKVQVIEQETTKSKAKIDKLSTIKSNLEEKLRYKEDIQRKEITRVSQLLIDITKYIKNIGILH